MNRLFAAFLSLVISGCAATQQMTQNPGQPTTEVVSRSEQNIDQVQLEPYDGPKARVAVYRFADKSAKGGGGI